MATSLLLPLTITEQRPLTPLIDLLRAFFGQEIVTDIDNRFDCTVCGPHHQVDYKKTTDLNTAPNFFKIGLKRFEYEIIVDPVTHKQLEYATRINSRIQIPQFIDLYEFMPHQQQSTIYQLQSIILHTDDPIEHYFTIVKDTKECWTLFNDSNVTEFNFEELNLAQPYVLFYQRISSWEHNELVK